MLNRYENENSMIFSTYENGEINFILKEDKIYYNTYTNKKSNNYYELYLSGLIPNLINSWLLFYWILKTKGDNDELQNYNRSGR